MRIHFRHKNKCADRAIGATLKKRNALAGEVSPFAAAHCYRSAFSQLVVSVRDKWAQLSHQAEVSKSTDNLTEAQFFHCCAPALTSLEARAAQEPSGPACDARAIVALAQ
jgi:hypothetical protein